jgi:uncharacterized protein YbbC (DUF1343 family)
MLYAVEDAGRAHKPIWILDRPNPITGTHIEGPMMEKSLESFIGCYDLPLRHGMTFGELASMANGEMHWDTELHVVKMRNWQRGDWFDSTALSWINPSPNMRSLNAALLYPGLAMFEADTGFSVGRGTDAPFEQIGASWIQGQALAAELNSRFIPGIRVYPTRFRPTASHYANTEIEGIRFVITHREAFDSTRLGVELGAALQKLYPGKMDFEKCRWLIGNREVVEGLKNGRDASVLWMRMEEAAKQFAERRKVYLQY